jgi:hypothetical protein
MSENGIRGVDLFKIAGESISGWIPSWKLGGQKPSRQPFCSLMEERLLMYLEYHPQVVWYGRGDISPTFASTYKITTPLPTPFTINYLFDGNAHVYLPDAIGQLQDGSLLIAEAGMEQEKRRERNQAKAEAARKVASAEAWRVLDRDGNHLTPQETCQSRLLTCSAAAVSVLSRTGRSCAGYLGHLFGKSACFTR